uniref:Cyclic nucleotide-binding domain-containing protein n=1 Tax=Anolis carolinensis TaxID=28377 RepID=H9GHD3_ANOCA
MCRVKQDERERGATLCEISLSVLLFIHLITSRSLYLQTRSVVSFPHPGIYVWETASPQSPLPSPSFGPKGKKNWVLDPSGDGYYQWLLVMMVPIAYNWIFLICFLEEGLLVADPGAIAWRYVASRAFWRDVASLLPTDLLYLWLGLGCPLGVRANRLLRSPRLLEALDRAETRTARPHAFRLAKLVSCILAGIHWHGCLYFALSGHIGFGVDNWVYPNTSDPDFGRLLRQYLHSFYFSTLVLTTVGDTPEPSREEEFLFMAGGFLLAVLAFATIMGSVASVVVDMGRAEAAFLPEHDPVKAYLRERQVEPQLRRRVENWLQHLRMNCKMIREDQALRHLSPNLRAQVAAAVHVPALRKVQIFRHCERSFLEELVLRLQPQVYVPGEYVCRKGEVGREMFFVREGQLAVVAEDGVTRYALLGEGHYFGEISILSIKGNLSGNRRTANIRSLGYSDLFRLSKGDLAEVLAEFPSAKEALEAKGREILLQMGQLDTQVEAREEAQRREEQRRTQALQLRLDALQTRLARMLAGLESGALKLTLRLERLEGGRGGEGPPERP